MFAMKTIAAGLVLAGSVGWAPAAMAAPGVDFQPASKLWLEGNSTLHAYKSTAKNLQITATVTPSKDVMISDITELEVTIPVKSLKSGDGALDGNMYNAMNADKHPTVRFVMRNAKLTVTEAGNIEVTADGSLTIAGQERTTKLVAKGDFDGTTLRITGSKDLLMTDFGVKPPELMFGAIKTDNKIVVKYDLVGKLTD